MKWKQAYRNRLATVADVDKEIDRVKDELAAAASKIHPMEAWVHPVETWKEKLSFLSTLRGDLSTAQLPGL